MIETKIPIRNSSREFLLAPGFLANHAPRRNPPRLYLGIRGGRRNVAQGPQATPLIFRDILSTRAVISSSSAVARVSAEPEALARALSACEAMRRAS